jgi:hypothetical protein
LAPVGNVPFTTDGSLYKENLSEGDNFIKIVSGDTFEQNASYYIKEIIDNKEEWIKVYVYDTANDSKYCYTSNKFY